MNRSDLTDLTGPIRDRRRAGRLARLKWWLAGGLAVALATVLVWVVWFSSLIVVRNVAVTGTSLLPTGEVARVAKVPLGVPLMRVDTDQVAERVRDLAPVRDVAVHRTWPDAVTIEVTERALVFQVREGDRFGWVDADGVVFWHEAKARPATIIAAVKSPEAELLAKIAQMVKGLSPEIAKLTAELNASTVDSITLKLTDGRTIVWGSAERSELKSQVATALLRVDAKVIDVSAPEHPVTR